MRQAGTGYRWVKRQDGDPQDLLESLASIKGQVDALWVLPDSAVVTAGTVDMLFKFASGTNIPAIVFSKDYLKAGAAVALEPERTMMGKQAGELVCGSLGGNHPEPASDKSSKLFSIQINPVILQRLGIKPP